MELNETETRHGRGRDADCDRDNEQTTFVFVLLSEPTCNTVKERKHNRNSRNCFFFESIIVHLRAQNSM
jgi:hypothetical protein